MGVKLNDGYIFRRGGNFTFNARGWWRVCVCEWVTKQTNNKEGPEERVTENERGEQAAALIQFQYQFSKSKICLDEEERPSKWDGWMDITFFCF